MDKLSNLSHNELVLFKRQYLQLQADIRYPAPSHLRQEAFQDALYAEVFSQNALEHQPSERYQLRILKELMKRVESSIEDWEEEGISDDLMSRLSELVASRIPSEAVAAQQKVYVTYTMSTLSQAGQSSTITLLEARNLVAAAGTTGLRTWEACLHLATYLCSADCYISLANKSVLELGAGTGFLSILCAKYLGAAHVTASDGADTVVSDLPTNFFLNGLQDNSQISAFEFPWGYPLLGSEQPEWNYGRKIDVVLGADLTYDGEGIPALLATLVDVVELFPHVEIIIAATLRNEVTFGIFLKACESNSFIVDMLDFAIPEPEQQQGPFYSSAVPIRLCRLRKNKVQ